MTEEQLEKLWLAFNELDQQTDVKLIQLMSKHISALVIEVRRLRAAIEFVLADAESQHPGGWGPDVTMVGVLKKALKGEADDS